VCEDYSAIKAPVLAIGGWYDSYTNAVPRLIAGLPGRAWGIIGPWEHRYPHMAKVTPGIDFLSEAVRFWDHWLKGINNGVGQDPALRAYMIKAAPASGKNSPREGYWVSQTAWPSPAIATRSMHLDRSGLTEHPPKDGFVQIHSPLDTGLACGNFCPGMRIDDELPGDQRADDAKSVVFETPPLAEDLAILGAPEIELEIAADKPLALIAARLCDVAPDGASTRVSHNPFNLTHHASHEHPGALEPGKFYRVRFKLCDAGYIFPAGNRIRLALSSNYWPMVWPAPQDASLTVRLAGSALHLPVRRAELDRIDMPAPPPLPETTFKTLRPPSNTRTCETDQDLTSIEIHDDLGRLIDTSNGLVTDARAHHYYRISPGDPLSALTGADWVFETARQDWSARVETNTEMTCDATHFHLKASVKAFTRAEQVFEKHWNKKIARNLV
jgi:putative CocE/NonD family hydrolase